MKKLYLAQDEFNVELNRCMGCRTKPCEQSCPVNCCPQEFIKLAKNQQYSEALKVIYANNPMGQTCGLICPHSFCMKSCLRSKVDHSIMIPAIQATLIHDHMNEFVMPAISQSNGKKIAVVGAGPAGIAAAWFLAKRGYSIDLYEMSAKIGGALNLIPKTRLPHEVIEADWKFIQECGTIQTYLNHKIDSPLTLVPHYDGIIMAVGEQIPIKLNITGENNIISYIDYLQNSNSYNNDTVAVIGGGKVAFDCICTALQQASNNIHMFVRRTMSDIKMDTQEIQFMIEHNIKIHTNMLVTDIKQESNLFSIEVSETVVDANKCVNTGKKSIISTKFSTIVKAIGSKAETPIKHEKIIYAGDCKTGGSTVVEALASGIEAATILHKNCNFVL